METPRTREPLSPGTIIRMPDGFCCQITGPVISEGGGSLIYPVSRVRIDAEGVHRQELEYALKECFPLSTLHQLCRREDGAIIAEGPDGQTDEQAAAFLTYVKKMQLAEHETTSRIYHTAFRMVPIVESADEVGLSFDEGQTFHAVGNGVTVMESLAGKGTTLKAFMADNSRGVSALVALRIVQQLLYALREVHSAGYLHLDIQDGNILLQGNLDDGSIQATLIDFGCARPLQEDGLTAPITDRALFSTHGFSAPEMAHNDGTLRLGPQADLYSAGYLLLFLLTGTRYEPRSLANVRGGRVLTAMRMRHTQCPSHLQGSLQSLLQKSLAQDPSERYATADEMLRDVAKLADALAPKQSDLAAVAYDAFICYRHGERDDCAAAALRHALEHYRIPSEVRKVAGRERFERVFLDTDELSSCANLGAAIHDALVSAPWLIVVCSPDTPQSPWVAQEIDTFLEHHDASHVLTVLTAGEPDDSFPERLRTTSRNDMMFAADARAGSVREMERTIRRDTVLRVAAPMLGVSYDALRQRRRAWQMRRATIALGVVSVVALAFVVVVWRDNLRIQEEYANAQVRESRFLAQESQRQLFEEDNQLEAARIALEALPSVGQQRPYVAEAELALSEALRHYYPNHGVYYETCLDVGGEVSEILASDDQRCITVKSVIEDVVWVSTWDSHTKSLLWKRRLSDLATSRHASYSAYVNDIISIVRYVPGTDTLVVATYRAVAGVNAETGEVLWNVDLFTSDDHSNDGAIYGVCIPRSDDAPSDMAYLFYTPDASKGQMRIDALDVADGQVKKSIDAEMSDEWLPGEFGNLFAVAPSQDYAVFVCSRKDDDSDCVCVSMEDGSTVSSQVLKGLPMDFFVSTDDELHEDWFIATYEAADDDETPGTTHYARVEKAPEEGEGAGRSWSIELPMSQPWSNDGLSGSWHSTLVHSYRTSPSAFQLGQYIREDDGSISGKILLAADRDLYVVDVDSGKVAGHEVADATVVGHQWGYVNDTEVPFLAYADGGIDPFLISEGCSQSSLMDPITDVDGDPLYSYKLRDDLLLFASGRESVEDFIVSATVSTEDPTLVKLVNNVNDVEQTVATFKPSEDKAIRDIRVSARGDYLCVQEVPVSEDDSDRDLSDESVEPFAVDFTLYGTQDWQERASCEIDASIDRVLGITADGTYVLWQEKAQPGQQDGPVWRTELATGKSELLLGLDADADAHYAVGLSDAERGSLLVAVLSYEKGAACPYTARLYRDAECIAEMPLSLEADKGRVFYDMLKRETPLTLCAGGVLAFSYQIDGQTVMDVFVNLLDQKVCMTENTVASNSPAGVCLSHDGTRFASADSDGTVRVRDTRDGSLVCSCELVGSDLRSLSFIEGDSLLALYTTDYRLITIDAKSGEIVSEVSGLRSTKYETYLNSFVTTRMGAQQLFELLMSPFSEYHDISLYETDHDLIVCTALGEGCIIDRDTMAVRAYVPNIKGYSPSADALLVGANGSVYAYPVLYVDDLVAEGEALVSGDSQGTAGEDGSDATPTP